MSDGDHDKLVDDLAQKVLDDTGWGQMEIKEMLLPLKKATKEQRDKNRDDWR